MQNENNFEKHEKLKKKLKIAGFVLVIVGAVLALVAFIDLVITLGNPDKGMPKLFFLAFIGLPMLGIGAGLLTLAFRREIATYSKNESVPVINEASSEIAPAIQNVVKAAKTESGVRCECGALNDADAKFCKACGKPLAKTCDNCGEAKAAVPHTSTTANNIFFIFSVINISKNRAIPCGNCQFRYYHYQ